MCNIGEVFNQKILKIIPEIIDSLELKAESNVDPDQLLSVVANLSAPKDQDFMRKFANTQTFMQMVDHYVIEQQQTTTPSPRPSSKMMII